MCHVVSFSDLVVTRYIVSRNYEIGKTYNMAHTGFHRNQLTTDNYRNNINPFIGVVFRFTSVECNSRANITNIHKFYSTNTGKRQ